MEAKELKVVHVSSSANTEQYTVQKTVDSPDSTGVYLTPGAYMCSTHPGEHNCEHIQAVRNHILR